MLRISITQVMILTITMITTSSLIVSTSRYITFYLTCNACQLVFFDTVAWQKPISWPPCTCCLTTSKSCMFLQRRLIELPKLFCTNKLYLSIPYITCFNWRHISCCINFLGRCCLSSIYIQLRTPVFCFRSPYTLHRNTCCHSRLIWLLLLVVWIYLSWRVWTLGNTISYWFGWLKLHAFFLVKLKHFLLFSQIVFSCCI